MEIKELPCKDCPSQEYLDGLVKEAERTRQEPILWSCPHCNWTTLEDSCQTCINKHLRTKHNIEVEIGKDQETEDMLAWYGKKYQKEFKTIDELDTYILLNNLDNGKD